MPPRSSADHVEALRRYFGGFAGDNRRAFEGKGRDPLPHAIDRLFLRRSLESRTAAVLTLLAAHDVAGKSVLDLGCGAGDASIAAAALGAHTLGFDLVDDAIDLARRKAKAAGVGGRTAFRVADITTTTLAPADVTLIVGVIEYYADAASLLARAAAVTRELLIVVDTRGPWWRRLLRHAVARVMRVPLHYRPAAVVSSIVAAQGFIERARLAGHSYTAFAFAREQHG